MFLEKMKWPEVDSLRREDVLAICCISALEQHSFHLPMGTDYMIGSELVRRLESRQPDRFLCLPSIWLGASAHHMDFAGTISASSSTIFHVLRDVASSIRSHGFRRLLFLNSHGGNRSLLGCSVQELGHDFPDMTIVGATYWDVANGELTQLRETGFGGMGHACELETSIMLATSRDLVDMSKAESDGIASSSEFTKGEMLRAPLVAIYKSMATSSHHGGVGDPTKATPQKGETMLDAITRRLDELCTDLLNDVA